jgi:hypothetical protein
MLYFSAITQLAVHARDEDVYGVVLGTMRDWNTMLIQLYIKLNVFSRVATAVPMVVRGMKTGAFSSKSDVLQEFHSQSMDKNVNSLNTALVANGLSRVFRVYGDSFWSVPSFFLKFLIYINTF